MGLLMGGKDCKYANIDFKSSSVMLRYQYQGIGGRIGLPVPWCLPDRSAVTNISSVQLPNPVALSDVRFIAKLTPQGPTHAVRSPLVIAAH